jgi:hypothetical protein
MKFGEQAWAKVQSAPDAPQENLTEHRNWWPEVYEMACKFRGIEPDVRVRDADVSYGNSKQISSSG